MSHYAKVVSDIVVEVIVAEQSFVDLLPPENNTVWIQCSYNTHGGQHALGGTPLRKNYPGRGWTYDSQRDAFIPPKLFDAWVLNEDTCLWDPPWPPPDNENQYAWDNTANDWVLVE